MQNWNLQTAMQHVDHVNERPVEIHGIILSDLGLTTTHNAHQNGQKNPLATRRLARDKLYVLRLGFTQSSSTANEDGSMIWLGRHSSWQPAQWLAATENAKLAKHQLNFGQYLDIAGLSMLITLRWLKLDNHCCEKYGEVYVMPSLHCTHCFYKQTMIPHEYRDVNV